MGQPEQIGTSEQISQPSSELAPLLAAVAEAKAKKHQAVEEANKAQAEIDRLSEDISRVMEQHVGQVMLMEGHATRYFGPSDPNVDFRYSHGFEDWNDRNTTVTTGMRPMLIERILHFGIVVSIEGEERRPILNPSSLALPEEATRI